MENSDKKAQRLEVTTEPVIFEIVSEPYVILTYRGYNAVVDVLAHKEHFPKVLFIGSSSLSHGIEPQRQKNGGKFKGLKFRVHKESSDRFAKYIVEPLSKDVVVGEDLES